MGPAALRADVQPLPRRRQLELRGPIQGRDQRPVDALPRDPGDEELDLIDRECAELFEQVLALCAARHRPPYRPASPFPGPLAQPPQPVRLARKVCTAAVVYARDTQARARAARLGACGEHVLVGPWLSEVGFEVLYWIPMVRHLLARHQIDPGRVVALSRGGADGWYEGLAGRYLDALDWFTVDEVRQAREQHVALSGGEKQHRRGPFERILVARARETLGLRLVRVLHPSVMY